MKGVESVMIYRSERNASALAFFWLCMVVGGFLAVYYLYLLFAGLASWWPDFFNVFIGLAVVVLIGSFYLNISYRFDEDARELVVRTGFFTERVKYKDIYEYEEVTKLFGFSSLSSKKIRIKHGKFRNTGDHNNLFISPNPRSKFLEQLKTVCPKIKYVDSKKKK